MLAEHEKAERKTAGRPPKRGRDAAADPSDDAADGATEVDTHRPPLPPPPPPPTPPPPPHTHTHPRACIVLLGQQHVFTPPAAELAAASLEAEQRCKLHLFDRPVWVARLLGLGKHIIMPWGPATVTIRSVCKWVHAAGLRELMRGWSIFKLMSDLKWLRQ